MKNRVGMAGLQPKVVIKPPIKWGDLTPEQKKKALARRKARREARWQQK